MKYTITKEKNIVLQTDVAPVDADKKDPVYIEKCLEKFFKDNIIDDV